MATRQPRISKMHNVQETQKTVSKQTGHGVFAFSIFVISVDFAFAFWYKPLTLYRKWYKKYISIKMSFSSKIFVRI